jgi:hypothetical protein
LSPVAKRRKDGPKSGIDRQISTAHTASGLAAIVDLAS